MVSAQNASFCHSSCLFCVHNKSIDLHSCPLCYYEFAINIPNSNITQCECPESKPYKNIKTIQCVSTCPEGYRLDPQTKECLETCSHSIENDKIVKYNLNGQCVSECPIGNYIMYEHYFSQEMQCKSKITYSLLKLNVENFHKEGPLCQKIINFQIFIDQLMAKEQNYLDLMLRQNENINVIAYANALLKEADKFYYNTEYKVSCPDTYVDKFYQSIITLSKYLDLTCGQAGAYKELQDFYQTLFEIKYINWKKIENLRLLAQIIASHQYCIDREKRIDVINFSTILSHNANLNKCKAFYPTISIKNSYIQINELGVNANMSISTYYKNPIFITVCSFNVSQMGNTVFLLIQSTQSDSDIQSGFVDYNISIKYQNSKFGQWEIESQKWNMQDDTFLIQQNNQDIQSLSQFYIFADGMTQELINQIEDDGKDKENNFLFILFLVLGILAAIIGCCMGCCYIIRKKKRRNYLKKYGTLQNLKSTDVTANNTDMESKKFKEQVTILDNVDIQSAHHISEHPSREEYFSEIQQEMKSESEIVKEDSRNHSQIILEDGM